MVVAFGQLIRDPLLHAYPLYNLHPSLLPRWRGAAPIERAIMAGDEQTGVCVIELVEALDAGPVHATELIPVSRDDDAGTVSAAALELGVPLLAAALRGETTGTPQPPAGVTLCPQALRRRPPPRLVAPCGRAGSHRPRALAAISARAPGSTAGR